MTLSFGQVIPVTGPNIGFQGTVSRQGDRVIAARQVLAAAPHNINFGDPAVIIPDATGGTYESVADFVATVANIAKLYLQFAGIAVREVKTQLTYPSNVAPGTNQVGYYAPGQMAELLQRGSITVLLSVGTPNAEDQVYTRIVANGAIPAGLVGDIETNPAATDQFAVATTLTEGSTAATVASGTNIQVGQLISGNGIAPGTYVAAVAGTAVTLSQAAIATFATTGSVLTFSNLFALPGVVARTGYVDANSMLEITLKTRVAA
jgi:hypothetical protein